MQMEIQKMIPETAQSLSTKLGSLAPGTKLKAIVLGYDEEGNVWLPDEGECEVVAVTPTGMLVLLPVEARRLVSDES